jgi:Spy/CpxP family protein refolding chaperone
MNIAKRAFTAIVLAGAAVSLATPAMADGEQSPSEWNWTWKSNMQSSNGLVNLDNNGNVCASLAGVLAPGATCSNS